MTKWCSGCEKLLTLESYHHSYTRKDGYLTRCKSCQRKYRIDNRLRLNEQRKLLERQDRIERNDRYWKKTAKYHHLNWKEIKEIFSRQGKKCFYCKISLETGNLHLEHYYPKRKDKIVIACADCNRLKWRRDGDEFQVFLKEYISRFL